MVPKMTCSYDRRRWALKISPNFRPRCCEMMHENWNEIYMYIYIFQQSWSSKLEEKNMCSRKMKRYITDISTVFKRVLWFLNFLILAGQFKQIAMWSNGWKVREISEPTSPISKKQSKAVLQRGTCETNGSKNRMVRTILNILTVYENRVDNCSDRMEKILNPHFYR